MEFYNSNFDESSVAELTSMGENKDELTAVCTQWIKEQCRSVKVAGKVVDYLKMPDFKTGKDQQFKVCILFDI